MGYLPMDYVQLQRSVSCSDSRCLKLVREIKVSNFNDFCNNKNKAVTLKNVEKVKGSEYIPNALYG